MSLDMSPERLNLLADDFFSGPIAAALRAAAWLAVPGNFVTWGFDNDGKRMYRANRAFDKVGTGPTALAAVLDAAGVRDV